MSDKRPPGVLGSLPRTRPHRRSDKRPVAVVPAAATAPTSATQPKAAAKPKPKTATPEPEPAPARPPTPSAMGTAVQAAAELAEIGLQVSARALRRTVSRIPRP